MAKSICGTMVYIAPEVLSGNEYSVEVDYWALGCLIFEMVTGHPPFKSNNLQGLRRLILEGSYKFPPDSPLSAECKSLISSLLVVRV
jgi:serine/threonine protein kinase